MLKLKFQSFGHLLQRADSFRKTLMLGKIEGRRTSGRQRGWDGWMASLTQWTWVWVDSGSWWWTGRPGVLKSMVSQRIRPNWVTELNWTEWTEEPGRLQSMGSQTVGARVGRIGKSTFILPSWKLKSLICHFEKWTKPTCWVKAENIISMALTKVTRLIIIWVYCFWCPSR